MDGIASADGRAPEAAPGPLIDLRGVSYTYEGETTPILHDVSLRVDADEFVLILGPSGCGKSTLLLILNGVIPHAMRGNLEGEALCCGLDVAKTPIARFSTEIGMVFQDPEAQIVNTRVRDEVCFGLENLRWPPADILRRQAEALNLVGLAHAGEWSIWDLSGGQKQRVSIAAVLAARPRLLVLDEPTANLDPAGTREVFAVLEKLRLTFGATIVMVEHRVDELADRVSRVVMMDSGRIAFDGPPREAFARRTTASANHVSASAWFPQLAEFALELAVATRQPLPSERLPLNQAEAITFVEDFLPAMPAPRLQIVDAVDEPSAAEPLLTVSHLRFTYGANTILRDVSFDLAPGSIVALLGRNGSGKTTLARTLMGINPPPRGTVRLLGKDLAELGTKDIAGRIGYVFQNPDHQFVTDRVDDEIAYGLRVRDYRDELIAKRVAEVLAIVDLERYRERSPFSLSLGERRRLSVATMLALDPKLLILDEPTIGQDHERARQLMGLMARLRERYNSAVLMITHDVRLVADWADRALVLHEGILRFDGTPAELFARSALLDEAGLIPPPVQALSTELARRHPLTVPHATLSVAELVGWLAAAPARVASGPMKV